ncbi:mpv17-like protein [Anabrus simplex]|uniref:mpv17-like protein n=1 Tax=Anabrus simplex TaxID=316456 RepID=UPI0035A2E983
MNSVYVKVIAFTKKYPVTRGMAAYATIWPISSLTQQAIAGKDLDYYQALRFSLFGACFVAPTLHTWLRVATAMWPDMTVKAAITKALVEQISYGPAACICFFFGMSLLERKTVEEAALEVKTKFVPTYKFGIMIWPVLQTINFALIPERNRVPFVSLCSFMWTSFLAYMKQLEAKTLLEKDPNPVNIIPLQTLVRLKTSQPASSSPVPFSI